MSLILLYLSIPLFIKETTVTIHFFFHFSFFIIQSLSLFVSLCFLSLSLFLFPSQCLSFSSLSLSRTFTFLLHYLSLSLSLSLLFNCSARDFCPCSDWLFSSMPLFWGEGGRGMRTPALKFARLVSLCRWCHLFRLEAATQFLVIS